MESLGVLYHHINCSLSITSINCNRVLLCFPILTHDKTFVRLHACLTPAYGDYEHHTVHATDSSAIGTTTFFILVMQLELKK